MSIQLSRWHALYGRVVALAIAVSGLAFAAALTNPANAQEPGPSVLVNQIDSARYPDISTVVTVLTASGVPAPGLATDAFEVTDPAGVVVTSVARAQDASLPLALVVVIDTSGSMDGAPLESARAAASQLIGQLGPSDQASIVAFSDAPRVVVPFTSDHATLTAAIHQLAPGGSTALYSAVEAAAYAARSSGLPRQAVVLLSDGQNESQDSASTEGSSLDVARSSRVPMFTVAYGANADTAYMGQLAVNSAGRAFAADQFDVAQTYADIASLLRSQYVVSLHSQAPADGQDATLRISVNVDGQVAVSLPATFVRGEAPPPAVPAAPAPAPAPAADAGGGSPLPAIAIGVIGVAGVLLIAVILLVRTLRQARAQRERDRHAGQISDELIPIQRRSRLKQPATDRTVELLHVEHDGETHMRAIGGTPLVIGSSPESDIRLASDDAVAARHATVWLGDGRLRLRHIGGSRPTLYDGRPVDVIILEPGDEFTIGRDRFRVGVVSSAEPTQRSERSLDANAMRNSS